MASVVVSGDTSGAITLAVPAIAGTNTITLPASTGTAVVGSSAVSAAGQIPFSTDGSTYTPTAKIVRGTAVASTSGTAIDFTDIPSWVKRITVLLSGVSLSAIGNVVIQIGDAGGIETTGYVSNAVTIDSAGGVAHVASTTAFTLRDAAAAGTIDAQVTILNISGNTWIASGTLNTTNTAETGVTSGRKALSDVLTQVRITRTGSGVFDAGTINILYE